VPAIHGEKLGEICELVLWSSEEGALASQHHDIASHHPQLAPAIYDVNPRPNDLVLWSSEEGDFATHHQQLATRHQQPVTRREEFDDFATHADLETLIFDEELFLFQHVPPISGDIHVLPSLCSLCITIKKKPTTINC
jgi:hypothetical protein